MKFCDAERWRLGKGKMGGLRPNLGIDCPQGFKPTPSLTTNKQYHDLTMTSSNIVTEDDRYRSSTQFRLWSFSPASLLALRNSTNQLAADRVREAVRRAREAHSSADVSDADPESKSRAASTLPEGEVDCLTVEEELKLIVFYCRQTLQLGKHLNLPTDVNVHCSLISLFDMAKANYICA